MDERFVRRIISNYNPESFLPHNLSLNLLDYMVNGEDDSDSIVFLIHSVTVLYKHRFKIALDTPNSEIHKTFLFKSSLKKYILLLAQELDFRVKKIKGKTFTVEDVLF